MKNILITGGYGFVARHIADYLVDKKKNVILYDNELLGKRTQILSEKIKQKCTFVTADCNNLSKLRQAIDDFDIDCVFHLAANSDIQKSAKQPALDFDNTLISTVNLVEACKDSNVKEIVFTSSSAIFGEKSGLITEETGNLKPTSYYGASKLGSEGILAAFSELQNVNVSIIRFPNVYGDMSTHGVIHDFVNKLLANNHRLEVLGDGAQTKPFIHISDLVSIILKIYFSDRPRYSTFNIGGNMISVRKIAELAVSAIGADDCQIIYEGKSQGWPGDVVTYNYDSSKLFNLIGAYKFLDNIIEIPKVIKKQLQYLNNIP